MPPLQWDERLAASSQAWSDRCVYAHSTTGWGENWAWAKPDMSCAKAVAMWMTEPYNTSELNHATQVMWRTTQRVGCGFAPGCNMVTCQYDPPGNWEGQTFRA